VYSEVWICCPGTLVGLTPPVVLEYWLLLAHSSIFLWELLSVEGSHLAQGYAPIEGAALPNFAQLQRAIPARRQ
jgi:hypothetical protein